MNIAYVEALQNQFLYLTIAMNLSALKLQEKMYYSIQNKKLFFSLQ